ncbi:hypothetical protein BKA63DRAFT_236718 [Paraphoma chrysanthemicola]|nr:hypothetical protein BKA63DRAFT_236718 [Paraphoma chrysanthemicola]
MPESHEVDSILGRSFCRQNLSVTLSARNRLLTLLSYWNCIQVHAIHMSDRGKYPTLTSDLVAKWLTITYAFSCTKAKEAWGRMHHTTPPLSVQFGHRSSPQKTPAPSSPPIPLHQSRRAGLMINVTSNGLAFGLPYVSSRVKRPFYRTSPRSPQRLLCCEFTAPNSMALGPRFRAQGLVLSRSSLRSAVFNRFRSKTLGNIRLPRRSLPKRRRV